LKAVLAVANHPEPEGPGLQAVRVKATPKVNANANTITKSLFFMVDALLFLLSSQEPVVLFFSYSSSSFKFLY